MDDQEEKDEPEYDHEDCEECSTSCEENDIEYTSDFTLKDGTWVCNDCGMPQ